LGPSFAQCTPFKATRGGVSTFETKKKNIKPNVKINNLDEGYPLQNEGIASINKRLKHMIKVLQRWIKKHTHTQDKGITKTQNSNLQK
jgi:hypothetical protein